VPPVALTDPPFDAVMPPALEVEPPTTLGVPAVAEGAGDDSSDEQANEVTPSHVMEEAKTRVRRMARSVALDGPPGGQKSWEVDS